MSNQSFGKKGPAAIAKKPKAGTLRSKVFDKRRHRRHRMILPGKLWCGIQSPTIDCLIGDASIGGARVRVRQGVTVPNNVFLIHLREWVAYRARVVWRRTDGNLGLAFKGSIDLRGALTPELQTMRYYCAAFEDMS